MHSNLFLKTYMNTFNRTRQFDNAGKLLSFCITFKLAQSANYEQKRSIEHVHQLSEEKAFIMK